MVGRWRSHARRPERASPYGDVAGGGACGGTLRHRDLVTRPTPRGCGSVARHGPAAAADLGVSFDRSASSDGGTRARVLWARFIDEPAYPASAGDRRTFRLVGLELPLRATTALVVATLVLLFDFTRTAIPREVQDIGRAAEALRYQALERTILFGLV